MRRIQSILLTAAVLAVSILPPVLPQAEDLLEDVEIVGEEEVAEMEAGVDNSDLESPLSGAHRNKDKDQKDGKLIEEFVEWSVEDGQTLEEFQAAEAEEEARKEAEERAEAERLRALMEEAGLVLESASPDRMREYLPALLAMEDPIGSDGELEIGAYIRASMAGFGYTVSEQGFHEGYLNANFEDAPGINIIAERGADSDQRTRDIILICGRYDSVTAPKEDEFLENDKSAAAVLLECARILSDVDTDVDLCFLFLSGEEDGGYGSLRFAEHLEEGLKERIRAVIYIGPVGYMYRETAQESGPEEEDIPHGRVPYYIGAGIGQEDGAAQNGIIQAGTAQYFQSLARYGKESLEDAEQIAGSEETEAQTESTETKSEDWTIVEDTIGSRQYFADQGMDAIRIFQDVFHEAVVTEEGCTELRRRLRTQVVGEYVAEAETEETRPETSLDTAGGAVPEDPFAGQELPLYPVRLDVDQLCSFTDLLAGMVSLYMISDL